MLRVVVLRVLFFRHEVAPVFSNADLYWFEVVFTLVDADQLIRYLRHN